MNTKIVIGVASLAIIGLVVFALTSGGGSGSAAKGLDRLPAGAQMIAAVDLANLLDEESLARLQGVAMSQGLTGGLDKEALDLTQVDKLYVWSGEAGVGAIVTGRMDAASAATKLQAGGLPVQALGPNALVIGEGGVATALAATWSGGGTPLAKDGEIRRLLGYVDSGGADVVFAGVADGAKVAFALSGSGGVDIEVYIKAKRGDRKEFEGQLVMAKAAMDKVTPAIVRAQLSRGGGMAGVIPADQLESMLEMSRDLVNNASLGDGPDGGMVLTTSASGSGAAAAATMLATLAAVAVPAFVKYMRRAKTTEAIDQLDKVFKGAAVYFASPRVDPKTGTMLPCQFPKTVACTPEGSPCGQPDDRYPADPTAWSDPTWNSLMFEMNDAHYFKYCFESSGTLGDATFTASAHADLDCDGTWSTFQRTGMADADSTAAECSLHGSPAFFVDQETE